YHTVTIKIKIKITIKIKIKRRPAASADSFIGVAPSVTGVASGCTAPARQALRQILKACTLSLDLETIMSRNLLLLASVSFAFSLWASEPARVTISCKSLRFEAASGGPGQTDQLKLTSASGFNEINGEVAQLYNPSMP